MKLREPLAVVGQRRRLSAKTIEAYVSWIRQFLSFAATLHGQWTHPAQLGTPDVEAFLTDLVVRRR